MKYKYFLSNNYLDFSEKFNRFRYWIITFLQVTWFSININIRMYYISKYTLDSLSNQNLLIFTDFLKKCIFY